jgi:arsenate reductase (thioredoxin)
MPKAAVGFGLRRAAMAQKKKVLFLCTGNSARSIFGEYFLKELGKDRFEAHSAGAQPAGRVNPLTLEVLKEDYHIDAAAARSKSSQEFDDTKFDLVITVCDNARQSCPIFPGAPKVIHWNIADPAAVTGTDEQKRRAFKTAAQSIRQRVQLLCALPEEKLASLADQ